jgi:hypothetical protein
MIPLGVGRVTNHANRRQQVFSLWPQHSALKRGQVLLQVWEMHASGVRAAGEMQRLWAAIALGDTSRSGTVERRGSASGTSAAQGWATFGNDVNLGTGRLVLHHLLRHNGRCGTWTLTDFLQSCRGGGAGSASVCIWLPVASRREQRRCAKGSDPK